MGGPGVTGPAADGSAAFTGFPDSGLATAVPNLFFSRVMPEINDPAELVVSAYFFFAAQLHKRRPHYVSREELAADRTLIRALANLTGKSETAGGADHGALSRGLDLAVKRGIFDDETALQLLLAELAALARPAGRGDARRQPAMAGVIFAN